MTENQWKSIHDDDDGVQQHGVHQGGVERERKRQGFLSSVQDPHHHNLQRGGANRAETPTHNPAHKA